MHGGRVSYPKSRLETAQIRHGHADTTRSPRRVDGAVVSVGPAASSHRSDAASNVTGYKKVDEFLLSLLANALENITLLRCCRCLYYGANATENKTLLRTLAGPGGTGVDGRLRPIRREQKSQAPR